MKPTRRPRASNSSDKDGRMNHQSHGAYRLPLLAEESDNVTDVPYSVAAAAAAAALRRHSAKLKLLVACASLAFIAFLLLTSALPFGYLASTTPRKTAKKLTPILTQVVHRHGDRTPITPLEDVEYWSTLLPTDAQLEEIGKYTKIVRESGAKPHPAGGGMVFGRLTIDGLDQMMQLGRELRVDVERLLDSAYRSGRFDFGTATTSSKGKDRDEWMEVVDPRLWLRVATTDFSRTIQSVQGLLAGLLRESSRQQQQKMSFRGPQAVVIEIDAKNTNKMIPDPRPRRYVGQAELERHLQSGEEFRKREDEMRSLAVRVTRSLWDSGMLGEEAKKVSFGVGEDKAVTEGGDEKDGDNPLPWNQLAEILKCLERRRRLPTSISPRDLESVAEHNAWRWFALLSNSALGQMAIKSMAKKITMNGSHAIASWKNDSGSRRTSPLPPLLHIFSGHDASLIALMCAFKIERPAVWPEYGSHLKIELLRDNDGLCSSGGIDGCTLGGEDAAGMFYILFSLNGDALRSSFGTKKEEDSRYFLPWEDILLGLKELEKDLPELA